MLLPEIYRGLKQADNLAINLLQRHSAANPNTALLEIVINLGCRKVESYLLKCPGREIPQKSHFPLERRNHKGQRTPLNQSLPVMNSAHCIDYISFHHTF